MFRLAFFALGVFLCGAHVGMVAAAWVIKRNPELAEEIGEQYGHHAKAAAARRN